MRDRWRFRSRRVLAAGITLAVLGTVPACGGDGGTSTPGPDSTTAATAPDLGLAITPSAYPDPYSGAVDAAAQAPDLALVLARGIAKADKLSGDVKSPASDLAAELTSRLATHVYAVGSAVSTVYQTDRKSKQSEAAWAAVETNSTALIKLVRSLAAESTGKGGRGGKGTARLAPTADTPPPSAPPANPGDKGKKGKKESPSPRPTATEPPFDLDEYDFAKSWREHVGLLTDYALAARGRNENDQRTARRQLDGWASQAGQYFRAITKSRLSSYTVRTDLGDYLDAITEAIEGLASRDGESFVALREAADAMPEISQRLAAGLAAATDRKGSVTDKAAELRANLTATMTGHSYLTVMAFQVAVKAGSAGLVGTNYRRVQVSLDDNSKQIADLVKDVGGPFKEAEFLQGWRIHLRDLENYTRGLLDGDLEVRRTAAEALHTYLGTVSTFLKNVTKGAIPAETVEERLRAQLAAMIGAVDALEVAFRSN
ncbi:hypothetical protein GCM10009547_39050 [Sporichthya brevicatena]|uniref:Lipoprotein n=1 Tax=Sporichthya brevicatena TaxID=171442 RepID=A0ABP3SBT0_9ACTN